MADLISLEQAKAQIPSAPSTDDNVLAALITACSGVVENYCRRRFGKQTFTELLHGTGTPYLFVSNPPITTVTAVRGGMLPACFVQFNDPTNQYQAATVSVTASAVVLVTLINGTTSTHSFSFASYPTFGDLAPAINGVGGGWVCTLSNQFAQWLVSDLVVTNPGGLEAPGIVNTPGTWSTRNASVPLSVYWASLPFYRVNNSEGEIFAPGGFVPGYQNYRVDYVGGFDPIPAEIQYATAQLVALAYATRNSNPLMQSETLDRYTYTKAAEVTLDNLGAAAKLALNQYKLYRIARYC